MAFRECLRMNMLIDTRKSRLHGKGIQQIVLRASSKVVVFHKGETPFNNQLYVSFVEIPTQSLKDDLPFLYDKTRSKYVCRKLFNMYLIKISYINICTIFTIFDIEGDGVGI